MTKYTRTYTFLGTGAIWDKRRNQCLCEFDRQGRYVTDDTDIIKELLSMGVPYEDSRTNILARTEYAVEVLEDRIKILERLNEEQRIELEKIKRGYKEDNGIPDRDVLMAELDFLGAPYLLNANDITLNHVLNEYKAALRIKARRTADGSSRFDTDYL